MDIKERLARRFKVGLAASGHVFIRDSATPNERERKEFSANALPCYSTDTREEADAIVVRVCHRDETGRYVWPHFDGTLEGLTRAGEHMASLHRDPATTAATT